MYRLSLGSCNLSPTLVDGRRLVFLLAFVGELGCVGDLLKVLLCVSYNLHDCYRLGSELCFICIP
jgi:hypothetical protein